MEKAQDALRAGNLDEALRIVQQQVRQEPATGKHRIFLFQLLTVLGDWTRASNQLDVLHDLDASALGMVQTYRQVLECERVRADVFAARRSPLVFGNPEAWMALLLEGLRLSVSGQHAEARSLQEKAFEQAPAVSGSLDGEPFAWIADADSRLGPMLELIVKGQYYWIPFHRIKRVEITPPTDLRDLVWLPAHFTWANGGEAVGFIPTRYPESELSDDAAIRLARKTQWTEVVEGVYHGMGQRILTTDQDDFSLLDSRVIDFDPVSG
ncbi:type VI secretion system accessory protein TagJ [Methylocaldum sp.]|uniref:type VI secretion system accessory protein TagJ n=1 Tax=Methylocaldum sp. TaxID=1969727 RepID=UPI002D37AB21|nr:type VI secretion system accessory protein TagJ [Methylocaldum sp.]HYE34297.1 type VI secretion system accessory protein TagJ [Methylocaldum sp.]